MMKRIRSVLVATDFSPASRAAFRRAVELAARDRAALWIAHVLATPVPLSTEGYVLPRFYEDIGAALKADAEKRIRPLRARARKAGARAQALILTGVPHDALARAARRHRADLMVVGTHGRTGAARFFIGSVAARVIATAPCPVLTVRGR